MKAAIFGYFLPSQPPIHMVPVPGIKYSINFLELMIINFK